MKSINIDKSQLIELVNQKLTVRQIADKLGLKESTVGKRMRSWGIKPQAARTLSLEQRSKISNARKEWIKNNPEKFHSLSKSRNKSVPCERVKNWLREQSISFIEEYQPLLHLDRFFSIDIAFPDKKIGIEVNGNQHYNRDGTLADYYQKRHDLITAEGWILYELHYSTCFHIDAISKLIPSILSSDKKIEFDYMGYVKPRKTKSPKPSEIDPSWRNRRRPLARLYERPTKEELNKMVWECPMTKIGEHLGCVANTILKWCKEYDIQMPPQGYWIRRFNGYTHTEALTNQGRPKNILTRKTQPMTDAIIESVIIKVKEGATVLGACLALGLSPHSVRKAIRRKGLTKTVRNIRYKRVVDSPGHAPGTRDS